MVTVKFHRRSQQYFKRLQPSLQDAIKEKLKKLAEDPENYPGVKNGRPMGWILSYTARKLADYLSLPSGQRFSPCYPHCSAWRYLQKSLRKSDVGKVE